MGRGAAPRPRHALVGAGRRHADVGEHDVGRRGARPPDQRVEVFAHARDLDVGDAVEQARDGLANEVVVLGDHDPDRHAGEATRRLPVAGSLPP